MSNASPEDFGLTGDCPLCLSPLPPIWENNGSTGRMACCGKMICADCVDLRHSYTGKKVEGFHSRPADEQAQLKTVCFTCPFCRAFQNPLEEEQRLLKKSREGHGWADFSLRCAYRQSCPRYGKPPGRGLARKHLELAAQRGYPTALYELGNYYSGYLSRDELNIEPSLSKARENYLAAAERGHTGARHRLACSYLSKDKMGYSTEAEEDVDTAIELLQQAAEEGFFHSYSTLGSLHFPEGNNWGKGNIDTALSYLRRGAELRGIECLWQLGSICRNQTKYLPNKTFDESDDELMHLVNKDPATASLALFELGARQGCAYCQGELASSLDDKVIMGNTVKLFVAVASWNSAARYNTAPSKEAVEWCQSQRTKDIISQFCFNCLSSTSPRTGLKFNCCSRCKGAWYCGKECQVEHWKKGGHKNICGAYKMPKWTREDALKKTLDPFCVGIDPPQTGGQLSNYFSHAMDFYGTTSQERRMTPQEAIQNAKSHIRQRNRGTTNTE